MNDSQHSIHSVCRSLSLASHIFKLKVTIYFFNRKSSAKLFGPQPIAVCFWFETVFSFKYSLSKASGNFDFVLWAKWCGQKWIFWWFRVRCLCLSIVQWTSMQNHWTFTTNWWSAMTKYCIKWPNSWTRLEWSSRTKILDASLRSNRLVVTVWPSTLPTMECEPWIDVCCQCAKAFAGHWFHDGTTIQPPKPAKNSNSAAAMATATISRPANSAWKRVKAYRYDANDDESRFSFLLLNTFSILLFIKLFMSRYLLLWFMNPKFTIQHLTKRNMRIVFLFWMSNCKLND